MISKRLYTFVFFLAGTLILLIPALSNNFPFIYYDSGTYIRSGFTNEVPNDRTIFYGLFLRHISLNLTLWLPIIFQAFIGFFLIDIFVRNYSTQKAKKVFSLLIALVLTFTTGFGLFVGKLMPDIFTAFNFLIIYLLIFCRDLKKGEIIFLSILLYYGLMVHLSNTISVSLILMMAFLFYVIKHRFGFQKIIQSYKKYFLLVIVTLSSLLTIPLTNHFYYGKFEISAGSHVFLMGRMSESGVLRKYLDENCAENNYVLCQHKDQLPHSAVQFIWTDESPLYKTGGWENSKEEYDRLLNDIFYSPKYWKFLATDFFLSTIKQFFTFSPGVIRPAGVDSPPYREIKNHMLHELNLYMSSRQSTEGYDVSDIERRQNFMAYLSLAVFLIFLFSEKSWELINRFGKSGLIFILVLLLSNAFVCGALANVLDRLQGRVIWILPFFTLILITNYFSDKKLLPNSENEGI